MLSSIPGEAGQTARGRESKENLMAVFSCASTQRSSDYSSPVSWFRLIVVVTAFGLAGCNANQNVNAWSPTTSQVFAGHYVETNPYNPISYAQNNTGRGGH